MKNTYTRFIEINAPVAITVDERDLFGLTERNWAWIVGSLAAAFVLMLACSFIPR